MPDVSTFSAAGVGTTVVVVVVVVVEDVSGPGVVEDEPSGCSIAPSGCSITMPLGVVVVVVDVHTSLFTYVSHSSLATFCVDAGKRWHVES